VEKQALLVALRELRQMKADSDKAYKEEGILDEQFMNWISGKLATV